ncbi:unnamed protein product [Symbiodinium natans]|uniref:Uncharacterized protein n=1 Tax=Symbiodinium natans TaxID=878477 RepID=A0A812V6M1_9DINO|nr:unnamed protein product [Symbiodinium natans]
MTHKVFGQREGMEAFLAPAARSVHKRRSIAWVPDEVDNAANTAEENGAAENLSPGCTSDQWTYSRTTGIPEMWSLKGQVAEAARLAALRDRLAGILGGPVVELRSDLQKLRADAVEAD